MAGEINHKHCYIGHIVRGCWYAPAVVVSLAGPPAWAGPPFVTDDPDTPDKGHFEINLAAQYTHFLGGSVGSVPSLEVNYGVLGNLEATVLVPMNLSQVGGVGTNVGFGDVEVSFKYRFVDEDAWGWRPSIAIAPQINLPSGSEPRGLGAGRVTGFIPVWLQKDFNQWTVFGGGGPNINPGPDRKNWWFAGVGVLRELSPSWTVGGEVYYSSPEATGLKNTMGFNLGVIYTINDTYQILFSVGRNLINARDTTSFPHISVCSSTSDQRTLSMEKLMKLVFVPSPISRRACTFGLGLAGLALTKPAWAFDQAAYLARLDATRAELVKKTLADSKATLARLDELVTIGTVALREYGAKNPKYAKLMEAVVANAPEMKTYSDSQLEDLWGEKGSGGDAVGVPLKSLGDFDPTRNVMELIIGPSAAYIHIKKWQTAQRAKWLDQASDELHETAEHLNRIK